MMVTVRVGQDCANAGEASIIAATAAPIILFILQPPMSDPLGVRVTSLNIGHA